MSRDIMAETCIRTGAEVLTGVFLAVLRLYTAAITACQCVAEILLYLGTCLNQRVTHLKSSLCKTLFDSQEEDIPLGLRLVAKKRYDNHGRDIYWMDADEIEHPMIVLSLGRYLDDSKDAWHVAYEHDGCCDHDLHGLNMTDYELDLWLQGWNLQDQEQSENKGGSSAS